MGVGSSKRRNSDLTMDNANTKGGALQGSDPDLSNDDMDLRHYDSDTDKDMKEGDISS